MELRNCRRCHKLFHDMGHGICPNCVRELDDIFVKVRDALYDDPTISIPDLCEETGATENNIISWLREGRLIMGGSSPKLLNCESCGKKIASGRYCESCSSAVQSMLMDTARSLSPQPGTQRDYTSKKTDQGIHVDLNRRK